MTYTKLQPESDSYRCLFTLGHWEATKGSLQSNAFIGLRGPGRLGVQSEQTSEKGQSVELTSGTY